MIADLAQEWKNYLEGILGDPSLRAARQGLASWELAFASGQRAGLAELAETLVTAPRILLVAPPGWGKTTLLRAILYDYAYYARYYEEADLSACLLCEEKRLPVYLDLNQADALSILDNPPFAPAEDATRQEDLLLLIDHPEKGLSNLAGALKRLLSPQRHLVVAARDQDAPQIRPWLSPTAEVRLLPLGEEAAFRLLLAQGGDAQAQRMAQLLTTHHLWPLAQTPGLLHRLGQLASSGTLWGASRREILEYLCHQILGPPPSPAWTPIVELARLLQAQDPPARAEAASLFGGERTLDHLLHQGLLHETEGRINFAQSALGALFLAYALDSFLDSGRGLGKAIDEAGEEALVFLYDLSSHRQALIRELLTPPPREGQRAAWERRLLVAARCLVEDPRAPRGDPPRRGERPSASRPPGLKGLPPGIVDPNIYLGLGRAFRHLGRLEEARLSLEEGLRLASDRPDLRWELAQVQAARGQVQPALNHYQRLRSTMPPKLSWPLAEAQALAQAGQNQEALMVTQEMASRLAQELGETYQLLARLREEAGEDGLAVEAAQAAAQVAPGAPALILWGQLFQKQGQVEEARSRLEQAVLLDLHSVEARLALARFREGQGELSSAIAQLKEAVALAPDSAEAQLSLGRAYRMAGAYPQARFHLGMALALAEEFGRPALTTSGGAFGLSESPLAQVHAEFALLGENQGHLKEALYHIRLALDMEPERAEYRFHLGWIMARLGKEEAEAALRQALAAQPHQAAWHDRLGHLLLGQERVAEARDEFAAAVALEASNPLYHFNLGVALGLLGESQEALDALEQAIRAATRPGASVVDAAVAADAHGERGHLLEGLGRTTDALAEYEKAAALLPHHSDYRLSQALAYGRLGQHQLMVGTLEQTTRMNPEDPMAHFLLGQAYLTLGRYPEAAAALERACSTAGGDPEAGDYFKAWGSLLRRLRKKEAALAALQRTVELLPRDAEVHYQLGGAWEDIGDLKAALGEYRAAARHQVDNPTYWTAVGRLLRHLSQGPEAMMSLRTAISLHPDPSPAHAELGQALAEVGRLPEAYQALLHAASGVPEPEYWAQAARLAHQMGQEQQALEHLEEALKLNPERADLWAEHGQWLAHQERWEEARDALARAWELAPQRGDYALHLGQLCLHLGQASEAREVLAPLVNQHPEWFPGRLALAQALIGVGDALGALQQCQLVLKQEEAGEAYGLMAEALVKAGRWEEATAPLEKATALEPEEPRWAELLGRVHLWRGRPDLAEACLSRALSPEAPSRAEGLLGQALLAQGRYEDAVAALKRGLSQASLSTEERVAFLQALGDAQSALGGLGQRPEAWDSYDAALSLAEVPSQRVTLRRRRGQLLLKAGQPQAAIAELEAALPGGSQGPEIHLLLAQACRQAGEWEAALSHAHRAAQSQPQAGPPQRELGIILRLQGELGPAIKTLEAALATDPSDAAAWAELGQAYAQLGSPERARSALEQAVKEAPQEPQFHLLLGEWLLSQARPTEALTQAQEAIRLAPHQVEDSTWRAEAHALHARALAEAGRLEMATTAMAQAIALAPQEGEYHFLLGQWQHRLGQGEAALASLRQAVQLAPDQIQWRLELGRLLWEMASWEEAAAVLEPALRLSAHDEALENQPSASDGWEDHAEAAYLLGSALLRASHAQEALPYLTQATERQPQSVAYQMELGRAYLALGQSQAATSPLEKALQGPPSTEPSPTAANPSEWEEVALLLAEAYRRSRQPDAAEWLILKVIHQNPESAPGYAELGRLRWEQQRLPDAAAALGQAAHLSTHHPAQVPGKGEYLLELVEVLNLMGQDGSAREALAQVQPHDAAAWERVGRLYDRMGRLMEALSACRQAASLSPTPERLVQVARLARRSGDAAAAREALGAALSHNGGQAAWHNELGELSVEQGELEAALVSFQRAVEQAPKEASFHRNLGLLLETLGRLESAKAELERALRLDPADEVAFRHLGAVSAKLTLERWRRSQGQPPTPASSPSARPGLGVGPTGGRSTPPTRKT